MNPDDIIKSIHPDVLGISNITVSHPRFSPLTGVTLVQVCYYQDTTKKTRTWYGWPCEDVITEHVHQTAVLTRGMSWSFAGDANPVPFAVYTELKKLSDQLNQLQIDTARNPAVIMDCVFERFQCMDALSREQFYELLCEMPQFGDEFKAYVRRADALTPSVRNRN